MSGERDREIELPTAQAMADVADVEAALRELAREDRQLGAAPRVEQAVLEAFRRKQARWRWPMALAVAAALLMGISLALLWPAGKDTAKAGVAAPIEVGTDYYPLRAGPVLDAGEIGQVMRVPVSRATLGRFGLNQSALAGAETVQADVLIGMDGTARAVRFVR